MMPRLRLTLLVPAVTMALYVIAYIAFGDRPAFRDVGQFAFQAVSTTGCLLGVLSFSRGDYMGSAWRLYLACDLLILLTVALTGLFPLEATVHVRVVATLIANIVGTLGVYRFANAWRVAGIDLSAGNASRRSAMLLGFVIGCVLAVPGIGGDLHMIWSDGNREGFIYLCGALGDIAAFTFVSPVVLTAFTLRGGRVSWVWGLVGTSILLWLAYDCVQGLLPDLTVFDEGVRVAALAFTGAAGLAQMMVTRPLPMQSHDSA
jgi:hypothetical protein